MDGTDRARVVDRDTNSSKKVKQIRLLEARKKIKLGLAMTLIFPEEPSKNPATTLNVRKRPHAKHYDETHCIRMDIWSTLVNQASPLMVV